MGNCLRHQSSTTLFSDDDWDDDASDSGPFASSSSSSTNNNNGKTTTTATTEVKIKITKKQLAELLGKVDLKELKVDQVLAHLMAHSDAYDDHSLHRPWRPALQSIPE